MISRIAKTIFQRVLLLLLVLQLFSFGYIGEAAPVPAPALDSYALRLFTEDTVMRNPNASVAGYFEIQPGGIIAEPVLDLWYSYSPTTRSDLSTITISINGVPVVSRILESQQSSVVNWKIPLAANQFRVGTNEVSIDVVHRTIDGLCRDIDNAANWFIIRPDTKIGFKLIRAPYTLANYPRPFLDDYLASKINTVFYLPNEPDKDTFAALLNVATNWGARGLAGVPQRLEVRLGEPGQVPANEVVLGPTSKWLPKGNFSKDVSVLTLEGLANGYNRLYITGENNNTITKAVGALNRPQLVKTFFGNQMVVSEALPSDLSNGGGILKNKKGLYTLADLGYQEDIAVTGAFHQEAILYIPRPSNYKIGDGSYIELHFRHSKILDPKKSAVTVYINNIPIRSTALLLENAEKGILKTPIPASELNKSGWQVRFGFYHDLGIIDCSKRYDEVAWSVIEKETVVFLEPGKIERVPLLEDFPNNFLVSPNGAVNLTLLLPEKPSQEELTAALKLAYYIGQQNKSKIIWQVQSIAAFDEKKALGTVIALGKNDDASQWGLLKKYLPVAPEANGAYNVASWLEVMPAALNNYDICQIAKLDNDRLLYAFMYTNPDRMNNLLNHILLRGNPLSGQLTLVDGQGKHASFAQQSAAQGKGNFEWFRDSLGGAGGAAGTYAAVFAAVLVATLALMFFMRKRP